MERRHLSPSAYTVAWVSALALESAAAAEMLDKEHVDPHGQSSSNTEQYTFGQIGDHNIVMVRLPSGQMGNNAAAAVVARVTALFPSIRFAFMVGIGGGVPSSTQDIRLGDVVVGLPHGQHGGVVQYDFGKTKPDGQRERTGIVDPPPKVILNAIAKFRENHYRRLDNVAAYLSVFDRDRMPEFSGRNLAEADELFLATYQHEGGETCEGCNRDMLVKRDPRAGKEIVIHYGTIASGNQLMKDGVRRDQLSAELGGVLCFEMEAAGLASTFPCVVIRGICDYADSHKNKTWQPYAAATAAAVAKELLMILPAEEVGRADISEKVMGSKNYRVPFSLKGVPRSSRYVERPEEMRRLEESLLSRSRDTRQKVAVLYGLGGIGKTQLAVEFARRHHEAFTSVWWLDGDNKDGLKKNIADCIARIPEEDMPQARKEYLDNATDDAVHEFIEWLSKADNKNWLLVIDNVDRDYQQQEAESEAYRINDYIPEVDHGSVLITTRLTNLQIGQPLRVGKVDTGRAQEIFQKWYNQSFDLSEGNELLQLLDGLPLALAQAAAYMSETGMRFNDYVRLYKEQWKSLMEENKDIAPLESYGNRSIKTTWMVSYNEIREQNKAAANLLLFWAHLDNKTLPFWIFQAAANESEEVANGLIEWLQKAASNEMQFFRVVGLLRKYCLVESLQEDPSIQTTHPVVHEWAFHIQTKEQKATLSRLAILTIGYATLNIGYTALGDTVTHHDHQMRRQLSPHAESWLQRIEQNAYAGGEVNHKMLFAQECIGRLLFNQGHFAKAEKFHQRALMGYELVYGPNDPVTLDAVHSLGGLYSTIGKLDAAHKLYNRSLEGREKACGPTHISTLVSVFSLGLLYYDTENMEMAETMLLRALDGYERTLGADHNFTLDAYNCLGLVCIKQGQLDKAEKMLQHSLQGLEKTAGKEHQSTLLAMDSLGMLYSEQGKLEEAGHLIGRALTGLEKLFGEEFVDFHISVLEVLMNYGELKEKQGQKDEAKSIYERAVKGYETVVGKENTKYKDALKHLKNLEEGKSGTFEKKIKEKMAGKGDIPTRTVPPRLPERHAEAEMLPTPISRMSTFKRLAIVDSPTTMTAMTSDATASHKVEEQSQQHQSNTTLVTESDHPPPTSSSSSPPPPVAPLPSTSPLPPPTTAEQQRPPKPRETQSTPSSSPLPPSYSSLGTIPDPSSPNSKSSPPPSRRDKLRRKLKLW